MINLKELKQSEILRTIVLPIIVPTEEEILDKDLDLSSFPLNACYSKPAVNETNGKKQSGGDVRLTIEGEDNLPSEKDGFYLMTDYGHFCKACFSESGKQVKGLNTFEDEDTIGDGIKTILVEGELIEEFGCPQEDKEGTGIITKEVLDCYGGDQIYLMKTPKTHKDEEGIERDIWLIAFPCGFALRNGYFF